MKKNTKKSAPPKPAPTPKKPSTPEERKQATDLLISDIQKKYPGVLIGRAGSLEQERKRYSFGLLGLDLMSGGGAAGGRIHQFRGRKASGKTSGAYRACVRTQETQENPKIAWFHTEPFEKDWARSCGVQIAYTDQEIRAIEQRLGKKLNPDDVKAMKKQKGEFYEGASQDHEALLESMIDFIDDTDYHLIVLDSLGAIQPHAWEETKLTDEVQRGRHAALVQRWGKKLRSHLTRKDVAVLVLNHLRTEQTTHRQYAPGGVEWEHLLDLDVTFKQEAWLKSSDDEGDASAGEVSMLNAEETAIGQVVFWKINWTKIGGVRGGFGRYRLYTKKTGNWRPGQIDVPREAIDAAISCGVVDKQPGGVYYFDGEKIARGAKDANAWLLADPLRMDLLYAEMLTRMERDAVVLPAGVEDHAS